MMQAANLPTEIPRFPVGREDGGEGETAAATAPAVLPISELQVPIEFEDFCKCTGKTQRFVAEFQVGNGLFGCCPYCGDERVVRFSREVA
jgi:hypothetical protein